MHDIISDVVFIIGIDKFHQNLDNCRTNFLKKKKCDVNCYKMRRINVLDGE